MPDVTEKEHLVPVRKRRRDAFERSVAVFRAFRETATPEEMRSISSGVEEALLPARVSAERKAFLSALTGEQTLTEKERLERETASIARYFQRRRELLADSLSAPQVARLLGTTRQTPHDRAKAGTLRPYASGTACASRAGSSTPGGRMEFSPVSRMWRAPWKSPRWRRWAGLCAPIPIWRDARPWRRSGRGRGNGCSPLRAGSE
jgi:hypothetical protein